MERATYTVGEAASLLGVSRSGLYAAIGRGEVPGVIRIGRRVVVSREVLDQHLLFRDIPPRWEVEPGDVSVQQGPLKLWRLTRPPVESVWEICLGAVVCAATEEEARHIRPNTYCTWVSPEEVQVEYLGEAAPSVPCGVVLLDLCNEG